MPSPNVRWVSKLLKSGASILAYATAQEVARRCVNCAMSTTHKEHKDERGNSHYFCAKCGQHN
jgi:ribosomal protein S27AE